MMEWIISSTVLMALVIGLRTALKGRISLGLQYALWLVVLVRLLVPVQLAPSGLSIFNAADRVMETPAMQTVTRMADTRPEVRTYSEARAEVTAQYRAEGLDVNSLSKQDYREFQRRVDEMQNAEYTVGDVAAAVLKAVWAAGTAVTGLVLLGTNLTFGRRLRRSRRAVPAPGCCLPVYVSGAADTPCLFGLLRPAIYLPADTPWDEGEMVHILTHEQTHFRRGDHIWSVLRCVCLALHWYNPLVWICAGLSRRDGELACDEASIRALGEDQRTAYGRTLIGMTCRKSRAMVGLTATTMHYNRNSLRERIRLIARYPKTAVYTLILVVLVTALAVGCTFTGTPAEPTDPTVPTDPATESRPQQTEPPTQPPTDPPTDPPTQPPTEPAADRLEAWQERFDWNGELIFNRAAGHIFSRPEDVDLSLLFYNGVDHPGSWDAISASDRELLVREGFWTDLDIQIMPAAILEERLQAAFGVGLKDVKIPAGWAYSAESDTYYSNHSDAYINTVTVTGFDDLSDGTVRLHLLVDFVEDGEEYHSNAVMLMTLRPVENGWQILSNTLSTTGEAYAAVWRQPSEIFVYPFTDYAMDTAIRAVEAELETWAGAEGVLSFRVENIGFDPMSTDHAVLTELYGGNPSGLSLDDLYARRACFAVTYSAEYDRSLSPNDDVVHGHMLVTLARYVDTGEWYCQSATIHPGSDYPSLLLSPAQWPDYSGVGGDIVAVYRSGDSAGNYWIFVKDPYSGRILCMQG